MTWTRLNRTFQLFWGNGLNLDLSDVFSLLDGGWALLGKIPQVPFPVHGIWGTHYWFILLFMLIFITWLCGLVYMTLYLCQCGIKNI